MSNIELLDERTKRIFEGVEKGLIDAKYLANIDYVPRLLVNNPYFLKTTFNHFSVLSILTSSVINTSSI